MSRKNRAAPRTAGRRRWRLAAAFLLALAALTVTAAVIAIETIGVSPRLLATYIERRSSGHSALIEGTGQRVVPRQSRPDALGLRLPKPSTAFDVGEQVGNGRFGHDTGFRKVGANVTCRAR